MHFHSFKSFKHVNKLYHIVEHFNTNISAPATLRSKLPHTHTHHLSVRYVSRALGAQTSSYAGLTGLIGPTVDWSDHWPINELGRVNESVVGPGSSSGSQSMWLTSYWEFRVWHTCHTFLARGCPWEAWPATCHFKLQAVRGGVCGVPWRRATHRSSCLDEIFHPIWSKSISPKKYFGKRPTRTITHNLETRLLYPVRVDHPYSKFSASNMQTVCKLIR